MKKIGVFLIVVVLMAGIAYAYSFEEFIDDIGNAFSKFFSLTGFAVLNVASDASGGGESSGSIDIPEPPSVSAEKESSADDEDTEDVPSSTTSPASTTGSDGGSDEDNIRGQINVPSCSDFIDNNVNYFKKGTCKDETGKYDDRCSSDGFSVLEYSCGPNGYCSSSWHVCPNGCIDGACSSESLVETKPDLKILSVGNREGRLMVGIKNIGTKGTFFKIKFSDGNNEVMSNVNYYLDSDEIIDVDLVESYYGGYSVEIIAEDDADLSNNIMGGNIVKEEDNSGEITGNVVVSGEDDANKKESKNIITLIIDFFKNLF